MEDAAQFEGAYNSESPEYTFYEKPRTLPIPVRLEVANYSKKEGVELQTDLLNAQDRFGCIYLAWCVIIFCA